MLDLILSLIHSDKGYLFEIGPGNSLKLRLRRNINGNPISEDDLPEPDLQYINERTESLASEIKDNEESFEVVLKSDCQRIIIPLLASRGADSTNVKLSNGRVLGACFFCGQNDNKPVSKRKLALLKAIIQQVSGTLENEMLYSEVKEKGRIKQELFMAKKIQEKLISAIPNSIDGFEIATFFSPCETVTGDYFDLIPLSGSKIGIGIGDICGKGMPAALLASTVQAAIRSQLEYSESPRQIIDNLNRLLIKSTAESIFITLFFGILEIESGILKYINAGHPPPILVRKDSMEELDATTFALGIRESEPNSEKSVKFHRGNRLILYTDGIIESQNCNREIYGRKRLLELINSFVRMSNGDFLELNSTLGKITEDVAHFTGGSKKSDDVTLLAIERK